MVSEYGQPKGTQCFPYLTWKKEALAYTLCPCHQVEGEAQGDEGTLKQFLKDIDQGPPHSKVMKVDQEERDVQEGESQFEVRR